MLWNELKEFVMSKYCKTEQDLANAIDEFEKTLTPEKCQSYIDRLKKVKLYVNQFI